MSRFNCERCGSSDSTEILIGRFCSLDCMVATIYGLTDDEYKELKEYENSEKNV